MGFTSSFTQVGHAIAAGLPHPDPQKPSGATTISEEEEEEEEGWQVAVSSSAAFAVGVVEDAVSAEAAVEGGSAVAISAAAQGSAEGNSTDGDPSFWSEGTVSEDMENPEVRIGTFPTHKKILFLQPIGIPLFLGKALCKFSRSQSGKGGPSLTDSSKI